MLVRWKFLLVNNRNYKIILETSSSKKTLNSGMEHLYIVKERKNSDEELLLSVKIELEKLTEHNLKLYIQQVETSKVLKPNNTISSFSSTEQDKKEEKHFLTLTCKKGEIYPVSLRDNSQGKQQYTITAEKPLHLEITQAILPSIQFTQDELVLESLQR